MVLSCQETPHSLVPQSFRRTHLSVYFKKKKKKKGAVWEWSLEALEQPVPLLSTWARLFWQLRPQFPLELPALPAGQYKPDSCQSQDGLPATCLCKRPEGIKQSVLLVRHTLITTSIQFKKKKSPSLIPTLIHLMDFNALS